MSQLRLFEACPGLLTLRSNIDDPFWSYGIRPLNSLEDRSALKDEIAFDYIVDDFSVSEDRLRGAFHYCQRIAGEETLYYERRLALGLEAKMLVAGLNSSRPVVRANPAFNRLPPVRLNNFWTPSYQLTDFAGIRMLFNGYLPLHCSGYGTGEGAVAVTAPPNTGKTGTVMELLRTKDVRYMAEDLAFTDGKTLFACPWTSTFRFSGLKSLGWRSKTRLKLEEKLPPLEFLPSKRLAITDIFPEVRIQKRGKLDAVVILETADEATASRLDKNVAVDRLIHLGRMEFHYHTNPLLIAYSYFFGKPNLSQSKRREGELMRNLVADIPIWLVRGSGVPAFVDQIVEKGLV